MIDGLVKNEKVIFLRECFVFSVSARNKVITQRIFQPKTGYIQVKFCDFCAFLFTQLNFFCTYLTGAALLTITQNL